MPLMPGPSPHLPSVTAVSLGPLLLVIMVCSLLEVITSAWFMERPVLSIWRKRLNRCVSHLRHVHTVPPDAWTLFHELQYFRMIYLLRTWDSLIYRFGVYELKGCDARMHTIGVNGSVQLKTETCEFGISFTELQCVQCGWGRAFF